MICRRDKGGIARRAPWLLLIFLLIALRGLCKRE